MVYTAININLVCCARQWFRRYIFLQLWNSQKPRTLRNAGIPSGQELNDLHIILYCSKMELLTKHGIRFLDEVFQIYGS